MTSIDTDKGLDYKVDSVFCREFASNYARKRKNHFFVTCYTTRLRTRSDCNYIFKRNIFSA